MSDPGWWEGFAMENIYVIQAFQETLVDFPPAEQVLKIVQFTERIEEMESADCEEKSRRDAQHGRQGDAQYDAEVSPGRRKKPRKGLFPFISVL